MSELPFPEDRTENYLFKIATGSYATTPEPPESRVDKYLAYMIEHGNGGTAILGYYYDGNFYKEPDHITLIAPIDKLIYLDIPSKRFYIYYANLTVYQQVGGGEINWGEINGTLSHQTDLNSALAGKANLENGKVPLSQLPDYMVADVVQVPTYEDLPEEGSSQVLYYVQETQKSYRWVGASYLEVASPLSFYSLTIASTVATMGALKEKVDAINIAGDHAFFDLHYYFNEGYVCTVHFWDEIVSGVTHHHCEIFDLLNDTMYGLNKTFTDTDLISSYCTNPAHDIKEIKLDGVKQTNNHGVVDIVSRPIRYGFRIKQGESNCQTRVEYLYDAVGMTPAYMDYTTGKFEYGSWAEAWFVKDNFPAMFKSNGQFDYKLDPNDYTKKLDGTASDVANTAYDGNAMSCIPTVWVKRWTDANYRYVIFSNKEIDSTYKAIAHERIDGTIAPYAVGPMFKGSLVSDKLRSISGQSPQSGTTAPQELNYARANDGLGANSKWGVRNHYFDDLIFDLLVLIGKSTNIQDRFGQGHSTGGSSAADFLTTGTLKDKGQFYGYSTTTSAMKVFHMENFYAERWDRQEGMICSEGKALVAEHTADFNFDGTNYKDINVTFAASGEYVKERITNEYGSFASVVGGSETTFEADYHYITVTGKRVPIVGGPCDNGGRCGRYVAVNNAASRADWHLGSSPFLKQPSFDNLAS